MPKTLIVAELQNGALRESTLELVALARKLGGDVSSVVIGSGIAGVAEDLSKKGGGTVLTADDAALGSYTVDAYAGAIHKAIDKSGAETELAR